MYGCASFHHDESVFLCNLVVKCQLIESLILGLPTCKLLPDSERGMSNINLSLFSELIRPFFFFKINFFILKREEE